MFPIQPVGYKLIVLPLPKKEETYKDTNLVLPENANADLATAKVLAVSEELKGFYKPGDVVLYPSRVGVGQIVGNQLCLWLDVKAEQVWGIDESEN